MNAFISILIHSGKLLMNVKEYMNDYITAFLCTRIRFEPSKDRNVFVYRYI